MMVLNEFENAIVLQEFIQWRDFVISGDVINFEFIVVNSLSVA